MKTQKQVIADRPEYAALIRAVIRRVGMDSVSDITNYGIGGGFSGFIYTRDTVRFWQQHRKTIMSMLKEMGESLGENTLDMVAGFGCLKDMKLSTDEVAEALYSGRGEYADTIKNAMAWFAAEEVCRMFED